MSLLPAELQQELSQLLQALQSPDNGMRTQAEEHLNNNWTSTRPEVLLMGLAEQIQGAQDVATRSFAAVIFKRIALKTRKNAQDETVDLFISLAPEQAVAIRQKLLETLRTEPERMVRNKISYAVAEIARQHIDNDAQWPELLGDLFQLSISPDSEDKRETAYKVFQATPRLIEDVPAEQIVKAFETGFKDSLGVSLAAMEAFAAFFRNIEKKKQKKYYELIPIILNTLLPMKESGDSENLSKGLMAVVEIAEVAPKMFSPLFPSLVTFSIGVVQSKDLDDAARQNALELMATFADYKPSMCRQHEDYAKLMVEQCLSLMTDLGEDDDDAAEWLENDDPDADESDQNHVAGEQTMDRLANRLGGAVILKPTFHWLGQMMNSGNWRERHAALMAISAISEGCRDLMLDNLGDILDLVVPALQDNHPRVRWAGCNALGQMSTDFAPKMQTDFPDRILGAIIPALGHPEARVKSHAAAALVNFCEEAEKATLEPFLDDLLSQLYHLLQNENKFVQEQALSTIATIADAAQTAFSKYYDTLMPLLFNVLEMQNEKEYQLLRAKAMECATLIALAVGNARLGEDATKLVNILRSIQHSITDADDPQAQYLMHCWGRMCRVMEQNFLPYLEDVMPPLLKMGAAKADVRFLDDEDEADEDDDDRYEWIPVKGKVIGIKTAVMEDKHRATELLTLYAQVLEGDFAPYVAGIMTSVALHGLAFFFHDPVRYAAARLVPALLNCYKKRFDKRPDGGPSNELVGLWNTSVDKLLEVLTAEPAIDTLAEMYQCFYESVECVGKGCLSQEHRKKFIAAVSSALEDYISRENRRAEDKAEGDGEDVDDDDEEVRLAIEEDETLLSDMNKAFHTIFKNHGAEFLPEWQNLGTVYRAFLYSGNHTQRQWGLCIMDDVLEYCGPDSIKYAELISEPLLKGCTDNQSSIRQAAAYGIGVAAHHGGAQWAQFLSTSLESLFEVVNFPDARNEDNVYATENACAAIAKILHYQPGAVPNPQAVIDLWLETLPVTNDEEAAPHAYAYLAQLIEQQNPSVLNAGAAQKLFVAIAQALEADTLQGQTASKVCAATKAMLGATGVDPSPLMQQFSPAAQQTIMAHFA